MGTILKSKILELAKDTTVNLLGNDYIEENLQSCSYDLRVGAVFKDGKIFSENHNKNEAINLSIAPSEIVTILTLEEVNLPKYLCGTVFAINKLSSRGFLILNPGHIDPGYSGPITVCVINLSKEIIFLSIKEKIFTIIFEDLGADSEGYVGDKKFHSLNRKEKEEYFFRNNATKLSRNIFDLIKENEYKPFLKDLITEIARDYLWKLFAWIAFMVALIAGIVKIYEGMHDVKIQDLNKELNNKNITVDSLQRIINIKDTTTKH